MSPTVTEVVKPKTPPTPRTRLGRRAKAVLPVDVDPEPVAPAKFPDPLSLIDHTCDLDAVLESRTIGDAMQLLVPNLPGISCYAWLFGLCLMRIPY